MWTRWVGSSSADPLGGSSYEAGASTVPMSWTIGSDNWASVGVSLNTNTAPTVTITPTSYTATEQVALNLHGTGISVSDDSASLTLTFTNSSSSSIYTVVVGNSGLTTAGSGATVSITGTVAQLNAFLAGSTTGTLTFRLTGDTPVASVTMTVTASDGSLTGSDTATINITAVNDAPVITAPASITVTEDVATAITGISIADADAGTNPIIVTLTVGSGSLAATSGGSVTVGGTSTARTLTGTIANINAFIAAGSVTFTTAANATSAVSLNINANDQGYTGTGGALYDSQDVTLNVTAVNDAPVVSTTSSTLSYTENAAATAIDNALTVTDVDSANLSSATIQITGNYQSSQDVLAFTTQNGITGVWNSGTGVMTLSGSATLANYQTALRSITYVNTSDNPSTLTRTVSFTVNDGSANSNTATRAISVAAVNDAPVVTTTGTTLAYTENGSATAIDNALTVTDVDSTNLSSATVSITANFVTGEDVLAFTTQNGITGSWNASHPA